MFKVGDKIRIIHMDGEPLYSGKVGVVEHIDDIGQIHGSRGGCALIPALFYLKLSRKENEKHQMAF